MKDKIPLDDGIRLDKTAHHEWRALVNRLRFLSIVLLSVAVDLVFVALWLFVHHIAGYALRWLGGLEFVDELPLHVFRWVSSGSTLIVILVYVVRDLTRSVRQMWSRGD